MPSASTTCAVVSSVAVAMTPPLLEAAVTSPDSVATESVMSPLPAVPVVVTRLTATAPTVSIKSALLSVTLMPPAEAATASFTTSVSSAFAPPAPCAPTAAPADKRASLA